jgi:AhpD family alkylhydroperoxidase
VPITNSDTESNQFQNQKSFNWQELDKAKDDIKQTFGLTPNFTNSFSTAALPGAWAEAKQLRFSENTTLDLQLKNLICLSVGALIPCDYISYFEKKSSEAQGISPQEQAEAIAMAAIVRHWSVVVNGGAVDIDEFKKEADKVIKNVTKMMDEMKGQKPPQEMFLVMPKSADEAYKDIEKTLGFVPKFFKAFSKDGLASAWSEFKALQLNPYTALSGKQKELIGLATAAQIPCEYCTYFHRQVASKLYGASEDEMNEAVSLAALTRHWSVIFNSPVNDQNAFRKEADQMIENSSSRTLH